MSSPNDRTGVDEPLFGLDDRLAPESVLELDMVWSGIGLWTLDCVCSCMSEGWPMMGGRTQCCLSDVVAGVYF